MSWDEAYDRYGDVPAYDDFFRMLLHYTDALAHGLGGWALDTPESLSAVISPPDATLSANVEYAAAFLEPQDHVTPDAKLHRIRLRILCAAKARSAASFNVTLGCATYRACDLKVFKHSFWPLYTLYILL